MMLIAFLYCGYAQGIACVHVMAAMAKSIARASACIPPFVVLGAHVGGGAFWICMRTGTGGLGLAAANFNRKN